jgi:probable F420-dependent oxidoreductase
VDLGVTVFMTDLTAGPAFVAREAEARGFASLYLPEHTHMPLALDALPASTEDELDDGYRRTLDPWIALATAAAVTSTIRLGTGVALVAQHDPIALAKQIATLDHLSGGRVVVGIGYGWNHAEMRSHGLDPKRRRGVVRDVVRAMRALWEQEQASHDGPYVRFAPSWAWPKPTGGRRLPVLVGGGPTDSLFAEIADWGDGWMPFGGAGAAAAAPRLAAAFEATGRDPASARIVPFGTLPTEEKLDHFASIGIDEVVLRVPATDEDGTRRALDDLARFLR